LLFAEEAGNKLRAAVESSREIGYNTISVRLAVKSLPRNYRKIMKYPEDKMKKLFLIVSLL